LSVAEAMTKAEDQAKPETTVLCCHLPANIG